MDLSQLASRLLEVVIFEATVRQRSAYLFLLVKSRQALVSVVDVLLFTHRVEAGDIFFEAGMLRIKSTNIAGILLLLFVTLVMIRESVNRVIATEGRAQSTFVISADVDVQFHPHTSHVYIYTFAHAREAVVDNRIRIEFFS